jgi:outer membrane murein-binding lipoprotein Lpp
MIKTFKTLLIVAVPLATSLLTGCASAPKQDPLVFTTHALAATDTTKTKLTGQAEQDVISRLETFSGDISASNITNKLGQVYAANIYFRDPFKEIHGLPDFQAYLLRDSASVTQYNIDWQDVAKSDGDYYFRWVMTVKLKRDNQHKPPTQTCGISEIRFGADGKAIYEQDYFDAASFLYERLPILGGEIRFIKKRL